MTIPKTMQTDLALHIHSTPLVDTHEHLSSETQYVEQGPDVLQDLFNNYVQSDLIVAGASPEAVRRLVDSTDPDFRARFLGVREAWERCQHTGYGEAVTLVAQYAYGMEEITPESIAAAVLRNQQYRLPGERLRLLRDVANLDHVQIDDFRWTCLPDDSGLDFFLYDLSWYDFSRGDVNVNKIYDQVGVEVNDVSSLDDAMAAIFAKYGDCAIAVKSQHAYARTLRWEKRDRADVERALSKLLLDETLNERDQLCLGDWCLARGVDLAIQHNLPFKIHTGYYAGHGRMPVDYIRSGHLWPLLTEYPDARFVLMHSAYPYSGEVAALAKHYRNTFVDMCWAWSIDPFSAATFVRRMIHAVPSNKLFAFGGDTFWPNAAVAFSVQARQGLTRALQAEVAAGMLTERQAIALATRYMRSNQEACFDLAGTRAAIQAQAQAASMGRRHS